MLKSLSPIDVALIKKIGGNGSSYTLPIATETTLGGVKPVAKTDAMTQSVGVDEAGALWTAPGGGAISGGDDSPYELAATIEITESVTSITQNFEKSYKELYIFFDKITASQNTQIVINTLGSENGFAGTNAQYRVSRIIHRSGIGMERQDSTGHGTYGFWQSGAITRRYDLGTDADINYVTIKPSNPNTTQITGGTILVYGRV